MHLDASATGNLPAMHANNTARLTLAINTAQPTALLILTHTAAHQIAQLIPKDRNACVTKTMKVTATATTTLTTPAASQSQSPSTALLTRPTPIALSTRRPVRRTLTRPSAGLIPETVTRRQAVVTSTMATIGAHSSNTLTSAWVLDSTGTSLPASACTLISAPTPVTQVRCSIQPSHACVSTCSMSRATSMMQMSVTT